MANEGFLFRDYYYEGISKFPDAYRLAVYDAVMAYAFEGKMPEEPGYPRMIVTLIKDQIDKDNQKNRARDK